MDVLFMRDVVKYARGKRNVKRVVLSNPENPLRQIDLGSQRVAVTGATGFFGGHALDQLRAANANVIGIVDRKRASSRHGARLEPAETIWFDHPKQIAAAVRAAAPDYVIHLHAVVTTERTAAAVARTLEENLLASLDSDERLRRNENKAVDSDGLRGGVRPRDRAIR
jgi:hypothetical protein